MMETINNISDSSYKVNIKLEADILSLHTKCEISDYEDISYLNIHETNTMLASESIKLETGEADKENNAHGDSASRIGPQSEECRVKNIKDDPDFVSSSGDEFFYVKHSPEMLEFIEVQNIQNEQPDEFKTYDPIDTNEGKFTCDYCGGSFILPEYCEEHKTRCASNNVEEQSTSTYDAESKKKQRHKNHKRKLLSCDKCSDKFSTKRDQVLHKLKHSRADPCTCPVCNKKLKHSSHVSEHMAVHIRERPKNKIQYNTISQRYYRCDQCRKKYSQKHHLKIHMRVHTGDRPYKCNQCDKSFSQLSSRANHLVTHSGVRYKCKVCDKTFSRADTLNRHMNVHTGGKAYQCHQCDKSFVTSNHLKQHVFIHRGEKPFKCQQCDKSFVTSSHLKQHVFIHREEKPFKCQQCDKSFVTSSHLKQHVFSHTGEKPYKCQKCDKGFTSSSYLKIHVLAHGRQV